MKITFLIQDLFYRGAQYATMMLANGFKDKGYDVDILVSKVHTDLLAQGKEPFRLEPGINLVQLGSRRARGNIAEIRKYLRTTTSDMVIAMDGNYETALAIASVGLVHRPRLFTVEHGIRFALNRDSTLRKPYGLLNKERLRRRLVYSRMDGVFTVCAGVAQELHRVFGVPSQKLHVVYNPVVDATFEEKLKYPACHPWLKDKSAPTFVAAGQLEDCKGHDIAIEAIKRLKPERNVRLIIYGEGPLRKQYETIIQDNHLEDNISLPGYTEHLPSEIHHSDGYISTSRIESFGITVVEALAAGVPVISTAVPSNGPVEILANGKNGRLIPLNDAAALASAINDVCLGAIKAAERSSWQPFTRDAILERYENACQNVEMLEPYKFDDFQFFKQWLAEAWYDSAGSIRPDLHLPWKIKLLLAKLHLAFPLPRFLRKDKVLLVTSGGDPAYLAIPDCYRYTVIPVVWDCWEKYWPRLVAFVRRNRVPIVFCTSSQTADNVNKKCPGTRAVWLPEGIKVDAYPMGVPLSERKVDVLEVGRFNPSVHDGIIASDKLRHIVHVFPTKGKRLFDTFEDLTNGLRGAKIVICHPRCDTHPELAGCVETLTQRYWECMLSGCLIVGRAPDELIRICGYNPVMELIGEVDAKICDILAHISDYQELVDRNRKCAEDKADWSLRVRQIRATLKEHLK